MNRLSTLIIGLAASALSVLAGACSDSSPTAPSQGNTTTSTFTVNLSAGNEVPPITNADANAGGTAIITLAVTRDGGGAVTSATADFQINVTGFPAGAIVTDAHIHNGPAGANAGVYVNAGLTSGELALSNGGGSVTKRGINVPADRAAAILANPAGHYFNVHTALNAAGAIRGQLAAGSATAGPGSSY